MRGGGLVLAALVIGWIAPGCSDSPQTVAGPGGEAMDRGEQLDAATRKKLLAMATPGEPMPPPRAPDEYPGDGQPFPLTVEVVSAATGEFVPYVMSGSPVDNFHPRSPKHIDMGKWQQDPDRARMSVEWSPAARWEFSTSYSARVPRYVFTCDVYERPPGGVLRIAVPQATLSGQMLDPTGAPAPEGPIEVIGEISEVGALSSVGIVHAKVIASGYSGPDGRFEIAGLIPGRYLVRFDGYRRVGADRWVRGPMMQTVAVGGQGTVWTVDPRNDRVFPERKGGGR